MHGSAGIDRAIKGSVERDFCGRVSVPPFVCVCSSAAHRPCSCAVVLHVCVREGARRYVLSDKIKEDIILSLSRDRITQSKCILPQGPMRGHYHISTLHRFLIHSSAHSSKCEVVLFCFVFPLYHLSPPLPLFASPFPSSPSLLLLSCHPMHY